MASASKVDLKDRNVAAVLAWLVPGLGHYYQGRYFKSGIYAVCILGTFFAGLYLGDDKVVNWTWTGGRKTYGYAAQVLVGLPALPALVQSYRAGPDTERRAVLNSPLRGKFEGRLSDGALRDGQAVEFDIVGDIELQPGEGMFVSGHFQGVLQHSSLSFQDGTPVDLTLDTLRSLEPAIYPSPDRELTVTVANGTIGDEGAPTELRKGKITGQVLRVRALANRFEAPLDDWGVDESWGDLGKFYELGLVYTWIAGLLNILAIWDAYEGPAYGTGDEEGNEGEPSPPNPHAASKSAGG
jgi:hypothetical protein